MAALTAGATDDPVSGCNGDKTCDGLGQCKLKNGRACAGGGAACASSFCSDSVCCDSACRDTCRGCALAGKEGACSVIAGQDDAETLVRQCNVNPAPPAGFVTTGTDCCDTDRNTFPGQTAYFTVINACGKYDYNCNNTVEKKNTTCAAPPQAPACGDNCMTASLPIAVVYTQSCR
jgi:hypothetical protein